MAKRLWPFMLFLFITHICNAQNNTAATSVGAVERAYMVHAMLKIADPVFSFLAKNELKKCMPVEAKTNLKIEYKKPLFKIKLKLGSTAFRRQLLMPG